jgi:hypothetical protein
MAKDINEFALELVKELKERTAQYEGGLLCAAEFVNEVQFQADKYHDAVEGSTCRNRITHCETYCCPATKTPGSEVETEKHEQFLKDYDSNTNKG